MLQSKDKPALPVKGLRLNILWICGTYSCGTAAQLSHCGSRAAMGNMQTHRRGHVPMLMSHNPHALQILLFLGFPSHRLKV